MKNQITYTFLEDKRGLRCGLLTSEGKVVFLHELPTGWEQHVACRSLTLPGVDAQLLYHTETGLAGYPLHAFRDMSNAQRERCRDWIVSCVPVQKPRNLILTQGGLVAPMVHLNGTGQATLMAEHEAAVNAVDAALTAVAAITVHGRDYYTQDDGAFEKAHERHIQHLTQLRTIHAELSDLWLAVSDQK